MVRKTIAILLLFTFVGYLISFLLKTKNYNKTLRVGVSLVNLVLPIDPMMNPTLANAFFSNNLYSSLIIVDDKNNYSLDIASRYWFDNQNQMIFFEIKSLRATAADASFTLKRIVFQGKQLHADIKSIICSSQESIEKCSDRISYKGDLLVINYFDQRKVNDIVPLLASVDYKIVPIEAYDSQDYRIAKIANYEITSGHYYMRQINKTYYFVRNKLAAKNIYEKYEIVDVHPRDLVSDRADDLIDSLNIIATNVGLLESTYKKLVAKNWNVFSTHNIGLTMAFFSESGIRKTSATERFDICSRILEELIARSNLYGSKATVQFFQDFAFGFLNNEQLVKIENFRNTPKKKLNNIITLGANYPERLQVFEEKHTDIKVVKISGLGYLLPKNEQPDVSTLTNDISFDLSLSVISYAAKTGILQISNQDLDKYASLRKTEDQINFINKVHFESLEQAKICPLFSVPYTTAFDKAYDHSLSKFNSRTLLWMIH
jgi:hypothetical protein